MDLPRTLAMLKALKLELKRYGKIEDLQAQVINSAFVSVLDRQTYQEGTHGSILCGGGS
jgi:hypothetical protein